MTLCANVSAGRLDLLGAAAAVSSLRSSGYYQANAYQPTNEKYKDINIDIFNFYEDLKKAMKGALWFDKIGHYDRLFSYGLFFRYKYRSMG